MNMEDEEHVAHKIQKSWSLEPFLLELENELTTQNQWEMFEDMSATWDNTTETLIKTIKVLSENHAPTELPNIPKTRNRKYNANNLWCWEKTIDRVYVTLLNADHYHKQLTPSLLEKMYRRAVKTGNYTALREIARHLNLPETLKELYVNAPTAETKSWYFQNPTLSKPEIENLHKNNTTKLIKKAREKALIPHSAGDLRYKEQLDNIPPNETIRIHCRHIDNVLNVKIKRTKTKYYYQIKSSNNWHEFKIQDLVGLTTKDKTTISPGRRLPENQNDNMYKKLVKVLADPRLNNEQRKNLSEFTNSLYNPNLKEKK